MPRFNTYLISGMLALGIVGCASHPRELQSIEDARATIQRVETSPLAGEVAAKEIEAAHSALREAENLQRKHRSTQEVSNAAYIAKRHAQIAQEQIMAAASKRSAEQATQERQAILLDAREREAALKSQEAERAKSEAEAAKQATNAARDAATIAQADAERQRLAVDQERARAAQLERELSDLNAKKTDRGYVLTLGDVLFDTGKATLKPGAVSAIDRLAAFLKGASDRTVMIEGHTDNVGNEDYNQALSQRRAETVQQALIGRGVSSDRIAAVGKGEALPVASNDSAGGRQQNRRVEIVIENPARTGANVPARTGLQ